MFKKVIPATLSRVPSQPYKYSCGFLSILCFPPSAVIQLMDENRAVKIDFPRLSFKNRDAKHILYWDASSKVGMCRLFVKV